MPDGQMGPEPGPPGTPPRVRSIRHGRRDVGAIVVALGVDLQDPADLVIDGDNSHPLGLPVDRDLDTVGGLEVQPVLVEREAIRRAAIPLGVEHQSASCAAVSGSIEIGRSTSSSVIASVLMREADCSLTS